MSESIHYVQNFLTPVILVSAIGLFCLGLYNRLAAVVNRMRATHREHFDVTTRLSEMIPRGDFQGKRFLQRTILLESQSALLLRRARLLRNALMLLLIAVLLLLFCSLSLGLLEGFTRFDRIPVAFLTVGVVSVIGGVSLAIRELFLSLDPVHAEGLTVVEDGVEQEPVFRTME